MDDILKYFTKLQTRIIKKLVYHLTYEGEFTNADYWYFKKLQEYKAFNDYLIWYISEASDKSPKLVEKMINDLGIDITKKYEKVGLTRTTTVDSILKNKYDDITKRLIKLSGNILSASKQLYLDTVEEMYIGVSTGNLSYSEAVINSIEELSDKGIRFLEYVNPKTGKTRTYDIPGLVRRDIGTAVRQTSNGLNMELIKDTECKYIHLSEHVACREDHFDWQGTIIKLEDLESVTDYGSITGLGGINCKHYFEAWFGDPNEDTKTLTKEQCEETYKQTQRLRAYERTERKWLYEREYLQSIEDKDESIEMQIKFANNKITQYRKAIVNLTKDGDIKRDLTREII